MVSPPPLGLGLNCVKGRAKVSRYEIGEDTGQLSRLPGWDAQDTLPLGESDPRGRRGASAALKVRLCHGKMPRSLDRFTSIYLLSCGSLWFSDKLLTTFLLNKDRK
jgi:hypothetical protein